MRVLALVTDAFGGHGGIALYNRDILTALCADPAVSEVVAIPRLVLKPLEDLPEKLIFATEAASGKGKYILTAFAYAMKKPRFDLIVCGHINLLPLSVFLKLWLRIPILLEIYGIDAWTPTNSRLANYLSAKVDRVTSISEITKQRFLAWSACTPAKVSILPNAIHAERYGLSPKNTTLLKRYGLEGKVIVMTLGRLDSNEKYKGFDEILEVLPALSKRIPNIAYLIAGGGDDRDRLEQKARDIGVSDRVVLAGFVAEAEKADYYRLADVYAMPGRGEGFGFVFLEAMACGIPVVASKIDGSREAVLGGELGEIVDPENSQELEDAICRALEKPRQIPAGLEYFCFARFRERLGSLVSGLVVDNQEKRSA